MMRLFIPILILVSYLEEKSAFPSLFRMVDTESGIVSIVGNFVVRRFFDGFLLVADIAINPLEVFQLRNLAICYYTYHRSKKSP